MSVDIYEWNTAKNLAAELGQHVAAVYGAARTGSVLSGAVQVESRPATPADQTTARKMYRAVRDEVEPRPVDVETAGDEGQQATDADAEPEHDVDELLADLAGCEARIEELEAENARLKGGPTPTFISSTLSYIDDPIYGALEAVDELLESQGIGTESTVDGVAELIARLSHSRETVERLKNQLAREGEITWGVRCDRDEYAARADRLERELEELRGQRVRGVIRRVVGLGIQLVRGGQA